jgi:type IV secretion system protein VirB11
MLANERLYLTTYLQPLADFLARGEVTDIYVNRPGEVWVETLHGTHERHAVADLTGTVLARLARQIASYGSQGISREHPLLAASLPDGARVQIVVPPATRGEIALAIRRHVVAGLGLAAYSNQGPRPGLHAGHDEAGELVPAGSGDEVVALLGEAVRERRNILVSGGTSTGKTTFLGALLREIPANERLVFIEDTAELPMTHENAVGLLAARGSMGEARITMEDLLVASLRMRPDRIILGEVRGAEALTFLRAANTGHPGSMTSIHADSPERAIEQLALLVLQTGSRMAWQDVIEYITRSLDVIVQLERVAGRRVIAGVLARPRTHSRGTAQGGLADA